MKATANGWTKEKIQGLLDTNDRAVERALLRIYSRQTADEQKARDTREHNGRGFTAFDAQFLTSLAQSCQRHGSLTPRQVAVARPKVKKYWKQLLEVAAESPTHAGGH